MIKFEIFLDKRLWDVLYLTDRSFKKYSNVTQKQRTI